MGWVTEHHPTAEGLSACVQCGLCLPVCPTFRLTGRETASPRGRIHAMNAVAEGEAEVDAKFAEVIDFCLGCRACEPVCPGMVPYGALLEGARAEITAQLPSTARRFRRLVVGRIIPSRGAMSVLAVGVRLLQRLRLVSLLPHRLRRAASGIRPPARHRRLGYPTRAAAGTVGLLVGCVQEQLFPTVNTAAARLLTEAGYTVVIPEEQTCCGALAAHDGHPEVADRLGEANERAFAGCDLIVATAAGCSAHLADRDGERSVDITVAVASAIEEGRLPRHPRRGEGVVVHDPCHLRHAQRSTVPPRLIVEAAGYDVVTIDDDGMCCGAAGLYTVLQPEASAELGRAKAGRIEALGPATVVSANPGCEMQLRAFLGPDYTIRHPVEIYLEALEATR